MNILYGLIILYFVVGASYFIVGVFLGVPANKAIKEALSWPGELFK